MNTIQELSPGDTAKQSVSKRLRFSRYFGRANLVAAAAAGVVNGDTIIRTGIGSTGALSATLVTIALSGVERYKALKSTNRTVMDFERAQYDAAPMQRIGGDVVDIMSRNIVAKAVEEKTAPEPPTTPPKRVTETTGYIGEFAPFFAFASSSVAYETFLGEVSDKAEFVSGTGLSALMAVLGGIATSIGERSLAYQDYVCGQRIDAATIEA